MSLTVDTQDLDIYPGIVKQVTLDNEKVIPLGEDGDEKFAISYSTTAYSDNVALTTIQDVYITDLKVGWQKSSGFAGASGKFALTDSAYRLRVKMDTTVSGEDGSGYYTIDLDYDAGGVPIHGELIAKDMEEKIRDISLVTGDVGYTFAYTNATVEWAANKFWIFSGTMASDYVGTLQTSVDVQDATTSGCSSVLGFDLGWGSAYLAALAPLEALLTQSYTVGDATLYIQSGTAVAAGDCMMITDGTNKDYFVVDSVANDTDITLTASGSPGYIDNSYLANYTKVQILREQDPEGEPKMYYDSIDKVNRHGVELIMSQIDYSS